MITLCTIGYEGASLSDFVATLKASNVQRVVDVRELPQSRRPGFSKNVLRSALAEESIQYEHRKELGDPKAGREAARAGNMDQFRAIFRDHLSSADAQKSLAELIDVVRAETCVLLCYERNPQDCHRKLLCDEMANLISFKVQHLGVQPRRAWERVGAGSSQHVGAC